MNAEGRSPESRAVALHSLQVSAFIPQPSPHLSPRILVARPGRRAGSRALARQALGDGRDVLPLKPGNGQLVGRGLYGRRRIPGRGPRAGTAPSTLLRSRRSRATAGLRTVRRGETPQPGVSWRPPMAPPSLSVGRASSGMGQRSSVMCPASSCSSLSATTRSSLTPGIRRGETPDWVRA